MTEARRIKDHEADHFCLFCGQELKQGWEEYTSYRYCDCPCVKHNENIKQQIKKLQEQLVKPKFKVVKRTYLINGES